MKKLIFILVVQSFWWTTGFSENPRWKVFGTPITTRTDLDVRWDAPTRKFPRTVWVYRLLPNHFSPGIISNLMDLCSFTEKDKTEQSTNGVTFQSADGSRKLSVAFGSGRIDYQRSGDDDLPAGVIEGVPSETEALTMAERLLPKCGIRLSDLAKTIGASTPNLSVCAAEITFFPNQETIIKWRQVGFRRAVNGMLVSGGDGGSIDFREHGNICRISISWRDLERIKSCPTFTRKSVMRSIREGKAFQGLIRADFGDIHWPSVKSVTIKEARPCYCSGNSDLLYPFLFLSATVDTSHGKVDVEIDCPIIDETKP
jgi:hypothetical protein